MDGIRICTARHAGHVLVLVFKFTATTLASKTLGEMNRGAGNESKSQWESAGPLLLQNQNVDSGKDLTRRSTFEFTKDVENSQYDIHSSNRINH
jgi:hypothetical protein